MIKELFWGIYNKRELFYLAFLLIWGILLLAIHPFPFFVGSDPVVYQVQAIGIAHGKFSYTETFLEDVQQKTYDPWNLGVCGFTPTTPTYFAPAKNPGLPIILAIFYFFLD